MDQGHSILQDKRIKGGTRVVWNCRSCVDEEGKSVPVAHQLCSYRAVVKKLTNKAHRDSKVFGLAATSVLEHGDLCNSKPKPRAKDATNFAAIRTAINNNKSISAKSISGTARTEGIHLSASMSYRIKRAVRHEDDDQFPQSFQLIEPYLHETVKLNPGSTVDFQA